MKYKLTDNQGACNYETYDHTLRIMIDCGCPSNILAGKNYVCKEHLSFALQSDRKPEVFAMNGTEITIKQFKQLISEFKPQERKEEKAWTLD